MSKRFSKARAPNCECTACFTCGPCLRAAYGGTFTRDKFNVQGTTTGRTKPPKKV